MSIFLKFFNYIFKDLFIIINIFEKIFLYLKKLLNSDFKNLNSVKFTKADLLDIEEENKIFSTYGHKNLREYYFNSFLKKNSFKFFDLIWIKLWSRKYMLKNTPLFRSYFRILSTKQGFFLNFKKLKERNFFNFHLVNTFFSGFKYVWLGIRFWILPLIIFFSIVYFTLVLRALPFNKIMFSWICILMFVYWLISGFVFFIKKYQFGKYTTAVQRFWRRSYILFWMIEGGTFLVFLYLTINSSQESFYMYDQINIYKTHLYSWKYFLLKIFPIIILIVSSYLLIITTKWGLYNKQSLLLIILTFFLSYLVWLEFYQFFHVVNFYGNLNWIYDIDDHTWSLELEPRRTRIVNHYVMLLFILKFWHIVFIYGFWIFFVLRCWETKRIRYPLLSANFQNFIILYIFAWVFMYPWFKFYFRKFLDTPYYWFYINNRRLFFRIFFNDIKLFYYGLFYFKDYNLNFLNFFKTNPFYYWKIMENSNNYDNYRKHIIKDRIINNLVNIK